MLPSGDWRSIIKIRLRKPDQVAHALIRGTTIIRTISPFIYQINVLTDNPSWAETMDGFISTTISNREHVVLRKRKDCVRVIQDEKQEQVSVWL